MVTVAELKTYSETTLPEIEKLQAEMETYILKNLDVNLVKVKVWLDGSVRIHTNKDIPNKFLMKNFNKKFGLYGHWNKTPGKMITIYEFYHWDKE